GMVISSAWPYQVTGETGSIGQRELPAEVSHHPWRDIRRVIQKGPQKADGAELEGHAETIMLASTLGDEQAVSIVKMKKPCQLGWRGFPCIPPVALGLFISEKGDWHPCSLSCGGATFRKRSLMGRGERWARTARRAVIL